MNERPIAFASRLLRGSETRWTITELEAFAVVWALKTFREWVEGSPILVRTDHSPLPYLKTNIGKSTKIARWVLALQDFSFSLRHRAGRCQNVPDALSRYATGQPGDDYNAMSGSCESKPEVTFAAVAENPNGNPTPDVRGDAHAFSAGGGSDEMIRNIKLRVQPFERRTSQEISTLDIRQGQATCPETILLKQVLDQVPGAKLPHWAEKEGFHLTLRNGVLCLGNEEGSIRLVQVPIVFRTGVIQRAHYGPYSAHFGKKETIGAIRTWFIWGTLGRDVKKVLRSCIHC